ncbi:MAG: helix-turn-helix transcriptional regulator [Syntrophales bacterium]|jgi:hypothetical protein|nr:helix-turn-helix transcriptional regulator [Syntrophales bacterium]MCK9390294.1 helix-turn-helix transcriptional regulator [Syntrophales bacterium]
MSNDAKIFYVSTDEIKTLLKVRGQSQTSLAKETGISLWVLNRFLNQKSFILKNGSQASLNVPHIKRAISEYLNISEKILWQEEGIEVLKKLIATELVASKGKRKTTHHIQTAPEKPWRVTTLLKNIVNLGKHSMFWGKNK